MRCFARPSSVRLAPLALVALTTFRLDAGEAPVAPPRLAVVISIDQCRADYFERFAPYFAEGGFRRLLETGAVYTECHYEHAATKTAVGHATILTGTYPSVHGIVANDWIEQVPGESAAAWPMVNAVQDDTEVEVGGNSGKPRSPRRLLATTVGEQLKQHYGADARVCSVANKDRSAILMGGKRSDGTYWLGDNDRFVSSSYFFPERRLPAWVDTYNDEHPVTAYKGRTWDHLIDPAEYDRVQGPDDAEGEASGVGLGRVFPRTIDGGMFASAADFSAAFDRSPFALEIIAEFARALVTEEHLGADATPDLLCVGFSQIDTVGHEYGPDSHEIMDSFLRLDRIVAGFLTFLDEHVGADNYVVVITADHGVVPMPERTHVNHPEIPAERVNLRELDRKVTAALIDAFGADSENRIWIRRDGSGYHVNPTTLQATGTSLTQASAVIKAALLDYPIVAVAFTRADLAAAPDGGHSLATLFRRSQHAERSPDVVFALKPYYLERGPTGTNHGTPWDYDTHVPLIWMGRGVARGTHADRVGVTDLAPTLAGLLGVPAPPEARGHRLF